MKIKFIRTLALFALLVLFGCSISPTKISEPAYTDPSTYPQMYTQEMRSRMEAVEAHFNVQFLGAYTLDGEWIFWALDKKTGACHSNFMFSDGTMVEESCEEGYSIYREICAEAGNCI